MNCFKIKYLWAILNEFESSEMRRGELNVFIPISIVFNYFVIHLNLFVSYSIIFLLFKLN